MFTKKYKLDRLVYYERYEDVHRAIGREKQIKGWLRIKKIALIVSINPAWRDLSLEWYGHYPFEPDASNAETSTSFVILSRVFRGEGSMHPACSSYAARLHRSFGPHKSWASG